MLDAAMARVRRILHVDMDAFYASVEQRDDPTLRGKPVIVGAGMGRGVVCAASYESRKFGVHSAMPISTARRLCPQAVFIPVQMQHYADIRRQIRALPEKVLSDRFGEMGRHIWQLANGLDDRTVVPDREAKSVSTETTFAHDIGDRGVLRVWVLDLVDHLAGRLRHAGLWARTID